jgi:hypothetical protein
MHDVEDPRRHAGFVGEFREPNGSGRVRSDGFRMKALPTAMAGASIQSGIMAGKLKGGIPATTPSGSRIE